MDKVYVPPNFKFWSSEELNDIEAKMSGTSSPMMGTINCPYKVDGQVTIAVYGIRDYWLKCTVDGAAKFSFDVSVDSYVEIYRTTSNLLDRFRVKKSTRIVYKRDEISDGLNVYYIKLHGNTSTITNFTVNVEQNRDSNNTLSYNKNNVLEWTPLNGSVVPSNVFSYNGIYYAKGAAVYIMKTIIEDDKYLKVLDNTAYIAANAMAGLMGYKLISKLAERYGKKNLAKAIITLCEVGLNISGMDPLRYLTSIRFLILSKIDSMGTFDEKTMEYPSEKGIYVDLHHIRIDHPEIVTDIGLWTGDTVYGARGIAGKWATYSGEF